MSCFSLFLCFFSETFALKAAMRTVSLPNSRTSNKTQRKHQQSHQLPPYPLQTVPTLPLGVSIPHDSPTPLSGGVFGLHVLRTTRAGVQYHKAYVSGWNLRKRARNRSTPVSHHHPYSTGPRYREPSGSKYCPAFTGGIVYFLRARVTSESGVFSAPVALM